MTGELVLVRSHFACCFHLLGTMILTGLRDLDRLLEQMASLPPISCKICSRMDIEFAAPSESEFHNHPNQTSIALLTLLVSSSVWRRINDRLAKLFESYGDKFEQVQVPDIAKPGAFDDAIEGVDYILHTASPMPDFVSALFLVHSMCIAIDHGVQPEQNGLSK